MARFKKGEKKGKLFEKGNQFGLKFDERRKVIFLEQVAKTGMLRHSARAAGVSMDTIDDHRKKDAEFAKAVKAAKELYVEKLEIEADRRAHDGVMKYVVAKGGLVLHPDNDPRDVARHFAGDKNVKLKYLTEQNYSDTLMTLRLKALAPEKYRENMKIESDTPLGALVVPAQAGTVQEWLDLVKKQQQKTEDAGSTDSSKPPAA